MFSRHTNAQLDTQPLPFHNARPNGNKKYGRSRSEGAIFGCSEMSKEHPFFAHALNPKSRPSSGQVVSLCGR